MTIEIIKPGLLTTLQDAGRPGYAHLGVGRAGAFDVPALRIANALCGNPRGACGLEITLLGPTLRFHSDARIAVTGAPLSLSINGKAAPMWAPVPVHAGATVTLSAMREGCRSYMAIQGGIAVDPVLGSRSTDVNAGVGPFEGRPLGASDTLAIGEMGSGPLFNGNSPIRDNAINNELDPISLNWRLDPRPWFLARRAEPLRLLPETHLEILTETSRKLLFSEEFAVSTDSSRVGVRLIGPKLEFTSPISMVSEGCVPGLLQLPPSGQPIAFGVECPVTGGYPRIGQVAAVDLPRLAQCRPGDALRFQPCTLDEALDALRDRERALTRLEATISARLAA